MIHKLLLFFLLLLFSGCNQSAPSNTSAMLYKITGNNLQTPSYIFGTFHTKEPTLNQLPPQVITAIQNADRLYTEIRFDSKSQKKIMQLAKYPKTIPRKQRMGPKLYKKLKHYLKQNASTLTLPYLAHYKLWAIAMMLQNTAEEKKFSKQLFMDETIIKIAKTKGIQYAGLETPLEQLYYFDALHRNEQRQLLLRTLEQTENITYDNILKAWYLKANPDGFIALQEKFTSTDKKSQHLNKVLTKGLIIARNKRFARRMNILLQNQPSLSYFFAIGAGHLGDKEGILSLLKSYGYHVNKIN